MNGISFYGALSLREQRSGTKLDAIYDHLSLRTGVVQGPKNETPFMQYSTEANLTTLVQYII